MAEAKAPVLVTYYLMRLDGELAIRETPIYFPKAAVHKGRTKAEDDRDTQYDVIFMDGRLTVENGSVKISGSLSIILEESSLSQTLAINLSQLNQIPRCSMSLLRIHLRKI